MFCERNWGKVHVNCETSKIHASQNNATVYFPMKLYSLISRMKRKFELMYKFKTASNLINCFQKRPIFQILC